MKSVWVLYERSDLDRNSEFDYENYATDCRVFEKFEDAKNAMKKLIRDYATEKNSLFDGNGCFCEFSGEIDEYYDDPEEKDAELFRTVEKLLRKLCLDELSEDDIADITELYVNNYMYSAEITTADGIVLLMKGEDDGPFNGIDPYVHTNIFDMDNEDNNYFFYVEDRFKMYARFISHLYIDLKKVNIE